MFCEPLQRETLPSSSEPFNVFSVASTSSTNDLIPDLPMFSTEFQFHLTQLGGTPELLSEAEQTQLDEQGFLLCPGLLSLEQVRALTQRFEELMEQEGPAAGVQFHQGASTLNRHGQEPGARRLCNLVNKGALFESVFLHPKLLAAAAHVLGRDFKLSSLNARDALPGEGAQRLHADWRQPWDGSFHVFNSIWLLDDFHAQNGCIQVVPGTQRLSPPPADLNEAELQPEPLKVEAPAGAVLMFNAHLWHGGTRNLVGTPRRVLHAYFTAWEHPQQTPQAECLLHQTWLRLSPSARRVLDVE